VGWFVVGVSYVPFYVGQAGEGIALVAFILHLSGAYTDFLFGWLAALST
jgi:hypothetical protein